MIAIDDLHKRFGQVVALAGVSLRVEPGERVAVVGGSGSGKTTLVRAICGLLQITGRVRLFGADVRKDPHEALSSLAYIPQVTPPLETPVHELVRAYLALRRVPPCRLLPTAERLGLHLAELARTPVRDLPSGVKQKLVAALALSSDALILVCDEPTAHLDAGARAAFHELIDERPSESILLLCSPHADGLSQRVGRIVRLVAGAVGSDTNSRPATALASRSPHTILPPVRRAG